MDLLTPSSAEGLQTLSLTTNSSWLPWGRVAMPLISPLISVPQPTTVTDIHKSVWLLQSSTQSTFAILTAHTILLHTASKNLEGNDTEQQ